MRGCARAEGLLALWPATAGLNPCLPCSNTCCSADEIYGGSRQDVQFRCALLTKAALEAPWVVPCGGAPYGEASGMGFGALERLLCCAVLCCAAAASARAPCTTCCLLWPLSHFLTFTLPTAPPLPPLQDNLVFVANDWHTSLLPFYLQARQMASPRSAKRSRRGMHDAEHA